MRATRVAIMLWAGAAVAAAQTTTGASAGAISGSVVDAKNNRPLAGVFVTAKYAGLPPLARTAKTDKDGAFAVADLPPGGYTLCVQVPGGGYLDPCQWQAATPAQPGAPVAGAALALAAGQRSFGNVLRLQGASVLKVRVDDAAQVLSQKTNQGRDHHLLAGVWGPDRLFYPMRLASTDKAGVTYELAVPTDTELQFVIASRDLKLADNNGESVNAGGSPESFQHRANEANPKSFRYTVIGVLP